MRNTRRRRNLQPLSQAEQLEDAKNRREVRRIAIKKLARRMDKSAVNKETGEINSSLLPSRRISADYSNLLSKQGR